MLFWDLCGPNWKCAQFLVVFKQIGANEIFAESSKKSVTQELPKLQLKISLRKTKKPCVYLKSK